MAGFFFDEPLLGGADVGGTRRIAFEQEGGAVADLGNWSVNAEVPDSGCDQVWTLLEIRCQVETLVVPVGKIAACGAIAHTLAVHIQNETVVRTDADHVRCGDRCKVERPAKMEDQGLAQRRGRMRDPGGFPVAVKGIGLDGTLADGRDRCDSEQEGKHNRTHEI